MYCCHNSGENHRCVEATQVSVLGQGKSCPFCCGETSTTTHSLVLSCLRQFSVVKTMFVSELSSVDQRDRKGTALPNMLITRSFTRCCILKWTGKSPPTRCVFLHLYFRAKGLMTRRIAGTVVLVLVILFTAMSANAFFTYELRAPHNDTSQLCLVSEKYLFLDQVVYPWIELLFYTLIASVVIIICNVLIIHTLCRRKKIGSSSSAHNEVHKIAPMLVLVSTTFVACSFPIIILSCKFAAVLYANKIQLQTS